MRNDRTAWVILVLLLSLVFLSVTRAPAQEVQKGPLVIYEDGHDTSPLMREMPLLALQPGARGMALPHRKPGPPRVDSSPDSALQQSSPAPQVGTTNGLNFDGMNDRDGFVPPDTNASVGASQVVETVNTSFQVFDKATGASVFGPFSIGSIWTGFSGICGSGNLSDPVVLYDKAAGRWLIAIVAFNSPAFTSNAECIAVSTTSDASGSFNRYAFSFGSDLNDYAKIGVWPDAYYLSANIFPFGGAFIGPQACALNRAAMLAGTAATMQCFQRGTSDASLLPADLDGTTAPPAGSPNFFLELGTSTTLNLFRFHVDFTTPSNSTFTGPTAISVPPYTDACASTGTCIPQQGTTQQLDSLGDRVMFRLAYRNFGSHESLVASHSVASGSSTGVRWYEIRSPNATPTLFQSGTFAPDSNSRWMPSIAMDKAGDIALGYSISSSSMFPSIVYTGRLTGDALGAMESETTIFAGSGSQTGGTINGANRWGDYTSMSVDPADDCTFWYANEYLPVSGNFNWNTRLASFSFPSCVSTAPDFTLSATPPSQTVVQGNSTSYTVTVGAVNGFTGTVTFSASGLPAGANATFSPPTITTSGSSTMTVTTASGTPTGSHTITVTGTSGTAIHTTTVTLVVNAAATPDFSLSASPGSVAITQGTSGTSTITITRQNGFAGNVTLSASGQQSGVTWSYSPNPASTSSSTLTLTASSTATTGTTTVTITGTSGSLIHTTTISLTVNPAAGANFSLSASPSSVAITRGSSGTSTITITRQNGFTGNVTLSASGQPSGVTASFSPNPATSASTITFTASSNAVRGTFTVTVMGTSASLSHTTTISLRVRRGGG